MEIRWLRGKLESSMEKFDFFHPGQFQAPDLARARKDYSGRSCAIRCCSVGWPLWQVSFFLATKHNYVPQNIAHCTASYPNLAVPVNLTAGPARQVSGRGVRCVGVAPTAGPPFPMQKVAIYCCVAYLSTTAPLQDLTSALGV
eukprot:783933-Pelagomonas_calceolata.AAC.1